MWASMPTRNLMSPSEHRAISGERALHSDGPRQGLRSLNTTPAQIAVEIRVAGRKLQAAGQLDSRGWVGGGASTRDRLSRGGEPPANAKGPGANTFAYRKPETLETRGENNRGRPPHQARQ